VRSCTAPSRGHLRPEQTRDCHCSFIIKGVETVPELAPAGPAVWPIDRNAFQLRFNVGKNFSVLIRVNTLLALHPAGGRGPPAGGGGHTAPGWRKQKEKIPPFGRKLSRKSWIYLMKRPALSGPLFSIAPGYSVPVLQPVRATTNGLYKFSKTKTLDRTMAIHRAQKSATFRPCRHRPSQ